MLSERHYLSVGLKWIQWGRMNLLQIIPHIRFSLKMNLLQIIPHIFVLALRWISCRLSLTFVFALRWISCRLFFTFVFALDGSTTYSCFVPVPGRPKGSRFVGSQRLRYKYQCSPRICGMFIPDPGSWIFPIPDPPSRIPDTITNTKRGGGQNCCLVETGNSLHTRQLDCNWFYSLKVLAHFRPKVLMDFLHSLTQITCLTGAIIARHILRTVYLNNNYVILHSFTFCNFTKP